MERQFSMWTYWRDKYCSYRAALHAHYTHLLGEPVIIAALAQIEMGQRAIDSFMEEKAEKEDDDAETQ